MATGSATFLVLACLLCAHALPADVGSEHSRTQKESVDDIKKELSIKTSDRKDSEEVRKPTVILVHPKERTFSPNGEGPHNRTKRFSIKGNLWKIRNLSYRVSVYPRSLSKEETDKTVAKAFKMWSDASSLTFERKDSGPVHIDIKFLTGDHGDDVPFDGVRGVVAHAFYPGMGGDVHFDDALDWTLDTDEGINLLQVATHEFGHSLGLEHTEDDTAVMWEGYLGYTPDFELQTDDINAIRTLYGEDPGTSGDSNKVDALTADLCSDPKVDTVFQDLDGTVYAFKGSYYWKILGKGKLSTDFPNRISDTWPGLPDDIDGAFTVPLNGRTYFFKKDQMWRYNGQKLDEFYPKLISEGFPGIPNYINDAMYASKKMYFFKDSLVWVFNPKSKPPVSPVFPVETSRFWKGVPSNVEAVIPTSTTIDFFKDGKFYSMDPKSSKVESIQYAGYSWFGCKPQKIKQENSPQIYTTIVPTNRSKDNFPNVVLSE